MARARSGRATPSIVISGKDKGKTGKVIEVRPSDDRRRGRGREHHEAAHQGAARPRPSGGIIEKPAPIHVST